MQKLIVTLFEHRVLGYVFIPYMVEYKEGKDYFAIKERMTAGKIKFYDEFLDQEAREIVNLVEEYNDSNLLKFFSKKKNSTQAFLNSIDDELKTKQIRPFIERRLVKIIRLMAQAGTELYFKVQTNNVYETDHVEIADTEAETVFNFIRKEGITRYHLSIQTSGGDIRFTNRNIQELSAEPAALVVDDKLYLFKDIDINKLRTFYDKEYVPVPASSEKKYYESFIKNTLKKHEVYYEGFDVKDWNEAPVPHLKLEFTLKNQPGVLLSFKYPFDKCFYLNSKMEPFIILKEEDDSYTFHRILRNEKRESEIVSALTDRGLTIEQSSYLVFNSDEENSDVQLYNLLNWVNMHSAELKEQGFVIDQSLGENNYYTGGFELTLDYHEDRDWFDIKAIVIFQGFHLSFYVFKKNVLKGEKEYVLPTGDVFIIPDEWFSRYKDFFAFAEKIDDENIRLKKQHFSVLDDTVQGLNDERFRELAEADLSKTKYEVPADIKAHLRPYQVEGYSWMYHLENMNFGVCLADDMGLGKTVQTLTLLQASINKLKEQNKDQQSLQEQGQLDLFSQMDSDKQVPPSLIIMPTSLIYNWYSEIKKFAPRLKVAKYHGSKRGSLNSLYKKVDIILTSYGILRNDLLKISDLEFHYVILDESQIIKNPESKTYKAVLEINSQHRLVLTGTPIENSLIDLWAQINFLNEGLLGNFSYFRNEYVLPIELKRDEEKKEKLKQLIRPFILRRTKQQVAKDLPEITEQFIYCDMSEQQMKYYDEEKSKARNYIFENIDQVGIEKSSFMILQALTKLRQIANHPKLVDEDYKHDSGKVKEVVRNMIQVADEGHKVLVFSSFVKNLELYREVLEKKGFEYCILTGETQDRQKIVEIFQNKDSVRFFLISLKAGGVGLNLTAADYVFMLDPWWNPAVEAQAINRAHRIGQQNKVFVYRYISTHTIEEKIQRLQAKKSKLAEELINDNNPFKSFTPEKLKELFE